MPTERGEGAANRPRHTLVRRVLVVAVLTCLLVAWTIYLFLSPGSEVREVKSAGDTISVRTELEESQDGGRMPPIRVEYRADGTDSARNRTTAGFEDYAHSGDLTPSRVSYYSTELKKLNAGLRAQLDQEPADSNNSGDLVREAEIIWNIEMNCAAQLALDGSSRAA